MASLTNKDREAVKESLLKEAFEPRFNAIKQKVEDCLRQLVKAEHGKFLDLMADESTRGYLARTVIGELGFHDTPNKANFMMVRPRDYGNRADYYEPSSRYYFNADKNCQLIKGGDVVIPTKLGGWLCQDADLLAEYRALWADYDKAYSTLDAALSSFRTREKFAEAFPEFAKRLPPAKQKAGLPVVIASNVLADLAAVGVPAVEEASQ